MQGLDVLAFLGVILFDYLLNFFHFLVEHVEKLSIFLIFLVFLAELLAEGVHFLLKMVVGNLQV